MYLAELRPSSGPEQGRARLHQAALYSPTACGAPVGSPIIGRPTSQDHRSHSGWGQRETRIVITGIGLVTPLAASAWQTFNALLAGRMICHRVEGLPASTDPVELVRRAGSVNIAHRGPTDPSVELADAAARQACAEAAVGPEGLDAIVASSKGAVHAMVDAASYLDNQRSRSWGAIPFDAIALGPHAFLCNHLRRRLGLHNVQPVIGACASGLMALHQARQALLCGSMAQRPKRVLVIASEAALQSLFIHSYKRLGVLCPLRPKAYCGRPLAVNRCGFMLSEVGAAVVVERCEAPRPGQIELIDTAVATEAHHLVRPSPRMEGLRHVVQRLIGSRQIDMLHPHAPGTVDHDPVEVDILGSHLETGCHMYACKGAVGHGLGAAGLVSLVLACLCARTNRCPPMPWLDRPIRGGTYLHPTATARSSPLQSHAVFAAGFGGHVAGAVLKRA